MKILITGASKGIGRDTALALAKHPEHQILVMSRNEELLDQLCREAAELTGRRPIDFLTYDLTLPDPGRLQEALTRLGGVDILINNAGYLINKPFEELAAADWQAVFDVNLFGVVHLIQDLLPLLRASTVAHVLNISSMGGYQGSSKFPGLSAYSAAKAAIANLTECLAEELRPDDIFVNCLSLGAVQTDMLAAAFPGFTAPVTSDQMGRFVAWFATNGREFFNGKILPVSVSTP